MHYRMQKLLTIVVKRSLDHCWLSPPDLHCSFQMISSCLPTPTPSDLSATCVTLSPWNLFFVLFHFVIPLFCVSNSTLELTRQISTETLKFPWISLVQLWNYCFMINYHLKERHELSILRNNWETTNFLPHKPFFKIIQIQIWPEVDWLDANFPEG